MIPLLPALDSVLDTTKKSPSGWTILRIWRARNMSHPRSDFRKLSIILIMCAGTAAPLQALNTSSVFSPDVKAGAKAWEATLQLFAG